ARTSSLPSCPSMRAGTGRAGCPPYLSILAVPSLLRPLLPPASGARTPQAGAITSAGDRSRLPAARFHRSPSRLQIVRGNVQGEHAAGREDEPGRVGLTDDGLHVRPHRLGITLSQHSPLVEAAG